MSLCKNDNNNTHAHTHTHTHTHTHLHTAYYSGSVLVGEPPSRLPPIKPSDDQPVVKPAEESPHNSFDSRRSVGEAGVLVPPQRVVAPSALPSLDKEEVPCKKNVPFLHSRGGDEVEMRKGYRLEEVSEVNTNSTLTTITSYGKDLDSVKGMIHICAYVLTGAHKLPVRAAYGLLVLMLSPYHKL